MTPLLVGCERSLKPVTPLLSEISLKWSVVGRQWCRRLHECSVPTRLWCQWLHECSVATRRSCLFGTLQAGSATNDTSVGCVRSLKPVTPLLSEKWLKGGVVGRHWCQWLHECSVAARLWCQWLHECSVATRRSCLFGTLQAGSATNDTSVGWLCAVFETGDTSVERNIAEMGCCGPTAVPVDGDGARPGFETTRRGQTTNETTSNHSPARLEVAAWPAGPGRSAGGWRQGQGGPRDRPLRAAGSRVAISRAGRHPPAHAAAGPIKAGHAAAGNQAGRSNAADLVGRSNAADQAGPQAAPTSQNSS